MSNNGAPCLWVRVAAAALFYLQSGSACAQVQPYLKSGHTVPVTRLVFSPDGRTLMSYDRGGKAVLWDFFSQTELKHFLTAGDAPDRLSGDSLFHLAAGGWRRTADGAETSPTIADEMPAAHTLPRCSFVKKHWILIERGRQRYVTPRLSGTLRHLSLSADGRALAYPAEDQYIVLRRTGEPHQYRTLRMPGVITGFNFHPRLPGVLAVALADGSIRVVDARGGAELYSLGPQITQISSVARHGNGVLRIASPRSTFYLRPATTRITAYPVGGYGGNIPRSYVHAVLPGGGEAGEETQTVLYSLSQRYTVQRAGSTGSPDVLHRFRGRRTTSNFLLGILATVTFYHQMMGAGEDAGPVFRWRTFVDFHHDPYTGSVFYNTPGWVWERRPSGRRAHRYRTLGPLSAYRANRHFVVQYSGASGDLMVSRRGSRRSGMYYVPGGSSVALMQGCDTAVIQTGETFMLFPLVPAPVRGDTFSGFFLNDDAEARVWFSLLRDSVEVHPYASAASGYRLPVPKPQPVVGAYAMANAPGRCFLFYQNGTADVVDKATGLIATYYFYENGDYIVFTPENYFFASSKTLLSKVLMTGESGQSFTLDQFEGQYNRPDVVLARLGFVDSSLVAQYAAAHTLYLERTGVRGATSTESAPEARILDWPVDLQTPDSSLICRVRFEAADGIGRVNVFNNNIPLFGEEGYEPPGAPAVFDTLLTIPLLAGDNRVKPLCIGAAGAKSAAAPLYIAATYPAQPRVWFLGIGVSRYKQARYNLTYAAKDIRDIGAAFRDLYGRSADVRMLLDSTATPDGVRGALAALQGAGRNDVVVISFSGHGVLDADKKLYLTTPLTDFRNPANGSVPYAEVDEALARIPAYRKVLLVDACNSGEVDSRASVAYADGGGATDERGATMVSEVDELRAAFDLMQDVYAGTGGGSGAVVISAARGNQSALEGDRWAAGAFTYAFLQGLAQRKADLNADKAVTITELKAYVTREVEALTGGRQKPTYRRDNLVWDWVVR